MSQCEVFFFKQCLFAEGKKLPNCPGRCSGRDLGCHSRSSGGLDVTPSHSWHMSHRTALAGHWTIIFFYELPGTCNINIKQDFITCLEAFTWTWKISEANVIARIRNAQTLNFLVAICWLWSYGNPHEEKKASFWWLRYYLLFLS